LPLFAFKGIPFRLHVSFVIFWVVVSVLALANSPADCALTVLVMGPFLLGHAITREIVEVLIARQLTELTQERVTVVPYGAAEFVGRTRDVTKDSIIAAAGALCMLPVLLIWFIVMAAISAGRLLSNRGSHAWVYYSPGDNFAWALVDGLAAVALLLLVIHLILPVYPLDASRIVTNIMQALSVPVRQQALVTSCLGLAVGLIFVLWGAIGKPFNPSLLVAGVYGMVESGRLLHTWRNNQEESHPLFKFSEAAMETRMAQSNAAMGGRGSMLSGLPMSASLSGLRVARAMHSMV